MTRGQKPSFVYFEFRCLYTAARCLFKTQYPSPRCDYSRSPFHRPTLCYETAGADRTSQHMQRTNANTNLEIGNFLQFDYSCELARRVLLHRMARLLVSRGGADMRILQGTPPPPARHVFHILPAFTSPSPTQRPGGIQRLRSSRRLLVVEPTRYSTSSPSMASACGASREPALRAAAGIISATTHRSRRVFHPARVVSAPGIVGDSVVDAGALLLSEPPARRNRSSGFHQRGPVSRGVP